MCACYGVGKALLDVGWLWFFFRTTLMIVRIWITLLFAKKFFTMIKWKKNMPSTSIEVKYLDNEEFCPPSYFKTGYFYLSLCRNISINEKIRFYIHFQKSYKDNKKWMHQTNAKNEKRVIWSHITSEIATQIMVPALEPQREVQSTTWSREDIKEDIKLKIILLSFQHQSNCAIVIEYFSPWPHHLWHTTI